LITSRPAKMAAYLHLRTTTLSEDDLVHFNEQLWITRLRAIAGLAVIAAILSSVAQSGVSTGAIAGVDGAELLASLGYRWWLRTRRHLRGLAYVQLVVDTAAIVAGLYFVYESALLFHFILLLVVVPASMIGWQCGLLITTLASSGHFLLLAVSGRADLLSVAGIMPPATFFLIAGQSLFYAQHVARKNLELEAAAASLNQFNLRVEEEAAISAALLRAAEALNTSLEPGEVLQRLNEVVREVLHYDFSATLLYDAQRNAYRVAAVLSREPEIDEEVRNVEFPRALLAAAAEHGVAAVESGESELFPRALMERWHVGSFLCGDLRHAGVSIGLLAAGLDERTGPFPPREVRLFRSIAQQAAIALENARLVESLRRASRLKSEFIGTMSHELRSPLNVVIGYVDLILDDAMGEVPAQQREALERVRQHALQLLDLIQEALDINRLEAGLLPLNIETFTLHDLLDDLRDSIPAEWAKPNVDLVWEVDPAPLLLRSDRSKLKRVLRNLVHNALKFTDEGSVTVKVTSANAWIDFAVSDTGIGISPEALPFIFDMFRQADGSNTRRYGGVGLGLYIVKQLVRGLGGDVSVASTLGEGSTFHVQLHREE
jgi:signal transduction histidine kinase